jgi:NitT/TauT family transport system substrate-binding protein
MTRVQSSGSRGRGRRTAAGVLGLAMMAVGLAACGDDSDSGAAGSGGEGSEDVTLVLDVSPYGKHAPFYVALEKGYWADRGLNVEIQAAKGSGDAVTKVASGAGDFALADTSAVMLARGNQGLETREVCMYHYKNLMSVLTLEGNGIEKPADIVGKTLHTIPGEGTQIMLPALAAANGFDESQVKTVTGEITSLVQAVVSGQVDGALTYYTLFPALQAAAEGAGKTASAVLYADNGVDIYNNGIVVADDFAEENPDTVKAMCAGFVEGVLDSVEDPDGATEIFTEAVPGTDQEVARNQLQVAIEHIDVPEVREVGFGPMDPEKMQTTVDLVNKYFDLETPVEDPELVYTNEFVEEGEIPSL